jgi:hypothetical protein
MKAINTFENVLKKSFLPLCSRSHKYIPKAGIEKVFGFKTYWIPDKDRGNDELKNKDFCKRLNRYKLANIMQEGEYEDDL